MWFDDAWNARLFLAVCESAGLLAERVLAKAAVTPDFAGPTVLQVPWDEEERLLAAAEELTGDVHIGLHLDTERFGQRFGLPGQYVLSQRTTREGVQFGWVIWGPTLSSVLGFELESAGDVALHRARWLVSDRPLLRHVSDAFLLYSMIGYRHMFARPWSPVELRLRPRPVPAAEYERVFQCPVRVGFPCDEMVVESELLDMPRPTFNQTAITLLKPHFEAHLEAMRDNLGTSLWLGSAMEEELREGRLLDLAQAAGRLHISARTLTARLAEEGTTYRQVMDAVRSRSAFMMLAMPQAKVESVALQLGFSGVAPFVRAFRRWTGDTPHQWRRKQISPVLAGQQ